MNRILVLGMLLVGIAGCSGDSGPTLPEELWQLSGTGNDVFDRPAHVSRVEITGAYSGDASNFIVYCGERLVVNELLGTSFGTAEYEGTHLLEEGCNPITVEQSSGVAWSFAEVR